MEPRELTIESLAAGGRGVARDEDLVWFVAGAVPGDRVLARPWRIRPRFVEAVTLQLLVPSPLRRPATCPIQSRCGGCPWMVLAEGEQRARKAGLVRAAIERIAGLPELPPIDPVLPPAANVGYRNRIEINLGADAEGRRVVGFWGIGPDGRPVLVDVPRCPIQHEAADGALEAARAFLLDPGRTPDACFRRTDPYRLLLRSSRLDGRVVVAVRETGRPFPVVEELAAHLMRGGHATGVVRLVGHSGGRGRTTMVPVAGDPCLTERIGRFTFELPPGSFVQVDSRSATVLTELVVRAAGSVAGEEVLDLYAGVGAFAMELAAAGGRVTAIEADANAVGCGRAAAGAAGIRVRFVQGDVGRRLHEGVGSSATCIVANPPRTGFGAGVAEGLLATSARRAVIVSCDPATLARDLARLAPGFRADRIAPIDLFPQTAHVECVATLVRR